MKIKIGNFKLKRKDYELVEIFSENDIPFRSKKEYTHYKIILSFINFLVFSIYLDKKFRKNKKVKIRIENKAYIIYSKMNITEYTLGFKNGNVVSNLVFSGNAEFTVLKMSKVKNAPKI